MKTKFSTRILALVLMLTMIVPMLVFTASAEDKKIVFNLGANGTASHNDGSSKTTYSETVDGYQLDITGGTNMYTGARDLKGNSCIKFGASSKAGSCSFTVPADVTSVVLYFAKYKANTSKVTVNGTTHTLTNNSNAGAYDEITVDTQNTKTVSITTVSGGYRAMLNTIEFIVAGSSEAPEPFISLAGDNVLQAGNTVTLTATLTNLEGEVAWTSSDDNVATVAGGVVTGVAMGTATITASVGEVQQTKEITVYPAEGVITVEKAIEIASFAGENGTPYTYQIMGAVESIEEYNEQYDNITVTIGDGSGSIYIFRMNGGADLQVGQQIAVSGKLQTYQGTPQVSQYAIYELIVDDSTEAILEALNVLELKMSLAYRYETTVETVTKPSTVTDTLNNAFTGISGTSYSEWSGKTGASGAVYAGQSAGGNSSIQMRTTNSNSGIVSTTSGGKIKSITITWNTNTTAGRVLNIYGSNTAYTQATDLYNTAKDGDKVTSFTYVKGTETQTYEFTGDYAYIGIRSNSGALYLDSIKIEWEAASGEGETVEQELYSNSQFAFRFGVDEALTAIEGVEAYGLMISAGDKDVYYSTDATSWTQGDELCYITLNLGDIINDLIKLSTKFTVKAYVEVDGTKYLSEGEKTYSVADMIAEYQGLGIEGVAHLYSYLQSNGLI